MNCAVKVPGMLSVYFLTEPPDDREDFEIEEGAWVEVPMNVAAWPEGARRPESVLCQSRDDPRHYKIFKYRNEIVGTEWDDTGLEFGGTFSKASRKRFASRIPAVRALQAITDEEGG